MAFDFFRGEEAFTWNTRGWQAVFNLAETYSSRRIPPPLPFERLRDRETAGNRQFLIRVYGVGETRVSAVVQCYGLRVDDLVPLVSYSLILASTAADQAQSTVPKRKATLDCSFG